MACLNLDICKNDKVFSRGLCKPCYNAAWYLVKSKEMTWEQLEQAGQCLAPRKTGVGSKASSIYQRMRQAVEQHRAENTKQD